MSVDCAFNLKRRYILRAYSNIILDAVNKVEITIFIQVAGVPGVGKVVSKELDRKSVV